MRGNGVMSFIPTAGAARELVGVTLSTSSKVIMPTAKILLDELKLPLLLLSGI